MSQHENNKDNQLADFADKALQGKLNLPASSSDAELVRLEETILRLKNTLPSDAPDSATSKQMLVRLKARMKREEEAEKIPVWKKLFDFQSNPQVSMMLAVAMILILTVITVSSLDTSGNSAIGTANNTNNFLIGAGLILTLLLVYWVFRRK